MMIELRPAIYIVMACAFGGCADEHNYCDTEQASCVCKPTVKLDMSSIEPPNTGAICNNATFDWMVHTMLIEMSSLNEQINSCNTENQKDKDAVEQLEIKNRELHEIARTRDAEIADLKRNNENLQKKLYEIQRHGNEAHNSNTQTKDEMNTLSDAIIDLQMTKKRLEFENIQLKERNELINQELEQLKQQTKKRPKDCADIQAEGFRYSGVFTIYPAGASEEGIEVFCDLHTEGGGWMVIQRRQDGSQRFDVDWKTYKKGFGKVAREFWLGNEVLHQITHHQGDYELRIDMMDIEGLMGHAHYTTFSIGDETSSYTLYVGGYSGNVGDSMSHHDNSPFSTLDVDNDESRSGHCSHLYGNGGWWYVSCYDSNLNGQYGKNDKTGLIWFHWTEMYKSLRYVEMKIRPVNFVQQQQK